MDESSTMNDSARNPVVSSMLWSAYADALGFMSELVDRTGLAERTGLDSVHDTVPWTYRIGGKYGTEIQLPAGMYSDDTQLRLATARAIGQGGEFNVEAFTKIELPIWLSYALGAGKGTRAAALNLTKDNIAWHSNFYNSGDVRYLESGGNGAAMRIQPHVWAAGSNFHSSELMLNITRNTISTHGHPRALVGALFHALVLADAIHDHKIPSPDRWVTYLARIKELPAIIAKDEYLGVIWLTAWERQAGSLASAVSSTLDECVHDVEEFLRMRERPPEVGYPEFLQAIGATKRATLGSGTKTAVASVALAWMFRNDPMQGVLMSANTLGSDTDTIGTMAGALLGVVAQDLPLGRVSDRELLIQEAERLTEIGQGASIPDFSYPSLLEWKPPKSASDSVGRIGLGYGIAGLGAIEPIDSKVYRTNERQQASFRWVKTTFGQTMLVKVRQEPPELTRVQLPSPQAPLPQPAPFPRSSKEDREDVRRPEQEVFAMFKNSTNERQADLDLKRRAGSGPHIEPDNHMDTNGPTGRDLERLTHDVIRSRFDPRVIGEIFLSLCEGEQAIEKSIAFAAILTKAVTARRSR
jgi:ADP-ribosylglycohydrolase